MNPQQPGGVPPHQFQEPTMPITPHAPTTEHLGLPEIGSQHFQPSVPAGPAPIARPEQQYSDQTGHPAGDQYEFIMNHGAVAKKPLKLAGGGSMIGRVIAVVVGLTVLVVAGAVVASLLGSKSPSLLPLTTVAQDQTELVRVSRLAASQNVSQTTQNVAISIQLSISSASQQLQSYLATNGQKLSVAQLGLKRDARTDTQLKTAAAASNFDSVFMGIIQTELAAYQRDLKAADAANPGPKGKQLLASDYTAAGLLLVQTK